MSIPERIASLRQEMEAHQIDAYLIPSADSHQSEYVGEHFKTRAFLTGFTGSAGDAIITKDEAGLWTDARYFLQAERQLAGTGITLYKIGEPGVPTMSEFLERVLPTNGTLGFDGRVLAMQEGDAFAAALAKKQVQFKYNVDLMADIWSDRPPLSKESAFVLDEAYAGESTMSKLARIRSVMEQEGATAHVLTSLDDICWIINMRGNDVKYSPLILSYLIIRKDRADLFIDENKLDNHAKSALAKCNFTLHPYQDIYEVVKTFHAEDAILIDSRKVNYAIYNNLPQDTKKIERPNPTILYKAIKNEVELQNIIQAHIKDGVAVTKFMHWLKTTVGKERITEISAAQKLEDFRQEGEGYLWQSFAPICGYKEHAAIVHYSATSETDTELAPIGMFLTDTGGNYYEGSTDITRTHILGPITEEERTHFTTVAKSNLNLASAHFLHGCCGYNLDILARQPMWDLGLDYKHGTGHGIGYLLNIHEGPAGFRWQINPARDETHPLEAGMVITNEPGIYIAGSHGIRTENELIVRAGDTNEYGQFLHFETITYAPIDLDGIEPSLMSQEERMRLNNYHKMVYNVISPHLNEEENDWLKTYTREI